MTRGPTYLKVDVAEDMSPWPPDTIPENGLLTVGLSRPKDFINQGGGNYFAVSLRGFHVATEQDYFRLIGDAHPE